MTTDPEVLSPSFFRLYDDLAHDAAGLEDACSRLSEAKAQRAAAQEALSKHQKKLRTTRAFIKEQKDRIALVSNHWFYGTTLLQPQLWLRGGCKGKIERAQVKLVKARDQDLPVIVQTIQQVQRVQLPKLEAEVETQLGRFEVASNAASEREVLRQRAFQKYPSTLLRQLQDQEVDIENQIKRSQQDAANLEGVIAKLSEAQAIFDGAKTQLETALQHNQKYESLKNTKEILPRPLDSLNSLRHQSRKETLAADGTKIVTIEKHNGERDIFHLGRNGRILATNFPCPNGCGFLVTWHDTHCCTGCKNRDGEHGRQCERKAVASQQGAQNKLLELQRMQLARLSNMNVEDDACNRSFSDARREIKRAERIVIQALNAIDPGIRERYSNMCSILVVVVHPPRSPGCGCASDSKLRASGIHHDKEDLILRQTTLFQQLSAAQQLQTRIRRDTTALGDQLKNTRSMLQEEQDRIFKQLRARVQSLACGGTPVQQYFDPEISRPPAFAPHATPPPSAPRMEDIVHSTPFYPTRESDIPMAYCNLSDRS